MSLRQRRPSPFGAMRVNVLVGAKGIWLHDESGRRSFKTAATYFIFATVLFQIGWVEESPIRNTPSSFTSAM